MSPPVPHTLASLGKRYLWWKSPDEIAVQPELLIAQIMNIGTWDDVTTLEEAVPASQLRRVLTHAEPGQFSPRSWHFWHLRLHVTDADHVPPPPRRTFQ